MNIAAYFKQFIYKLKKISSFETGLIDELEKDHKNLFILFEKINKYSEKKQYRKLPALLKKFHYEYKLHIIYEDNYFYTYMKDKYKNEPEIYNFILQKQEEMKEISNSISKFIKKYSKTNSFQKHPFKKELFLLGNALKKRIRFEETELYTLYN